MSWLANKVTCEKDLGFGWTLRLNGVYVAWFWFETSARGTARNLAAALSNFEAPQ